jgi:hypothetical protein
MEKPVSYYDWEQNFKKKSEKRKNEPKEPRIINSIGLPHDFFKNYLKLWKSENVKKKE